MARTPEQWLDVLAKRLDARLPYITLMRRYRNGDARLPELGQKTRAGYMRFQRKSRTNWGGYAVDARCDRIVYAGVTVGGSVDSAEAKAAALIVRNNRLEVAFSDAVDDCLSTGYGYLVVGSDAGGSVVTSEKPEQVIVAQDPLQPWRARAALKVWRDEDEESDFASVWVDGAVHLFRRPSLSNGILLRGTVGGWEFAGDPVPFSGPVPVFELEGRTGRSVVDSMNWDGGLSMLDEGIDHIDRINHGVLFRIDAMAMQSYGQRGIKTRDGQSLPEVDASGNVIDYSEIFEAAPGALWELPPEVEDIWESRQINATDLLAAVKDDLRAFGAIMGAPMPGVASDGENQSAEGARSGKEGTASKASKFLRRARPVFSGAMVAALRAEGFPATETVEVKFEPTDRVTLAEKMDAASKAVAAGMSLPTVQRDILGWSEQQIAEDERHRQSERSASDMALLAGAIGRQSDAA